MGKYHFYLVFYFGSFLITILILFGFYRYKVYEVTPSAEEQVALLQPLTLNDDFDFWSDLRKPGYKTTIMVSPEAQESFTKLLQESDIANEVVIEDVEQ